MAAVPSQAAGMPLGQLRFEDYQYDTLQWLERHRVFQTQNRSAELSWNAPQQWRPQGKPRRGILLIHGLGDSPWSFHDVGARLAEQGFLARSILLPGHGTQPADLLETSLEDWRRVVAEQVAILQREVGQVYLGGFSTGANLALEYAYAHPEIAGLLLFSPAFKSDSLYDWLTPWISWIRPWVLGSNSERPMQNAVRYLTVPTNGFAQFYRSSRVARRELQQRSYDKPVFMVVVRHDSVLDTAYLMESFQTRFTHPASRLVWYGEPPVAAAADDPRVLVRSDALPERRISQFSHMGLLFSPENPLYGQDGSLRICWNGQDEAATAACERGAPVWFSDWGYREDGKVHARLTYNPYFDWQTQVMAEVLEQGATPVRMIQATKAP
ncbi:alpha/beta hydrolase [Azomonas macrocytogenes]|uniref:Esterase/lipase n=1 Tax=Azomonas macrocytogenes TaxID=69962 RepID=A0A839T102_AZOMA|nr:alpha/beta fold hydrolase [Azomonas macrocytogenes]MBB3103221.1 esterase/lipase [Azomonas macrocytogenes]